MTSNSLQPTPKEFILTTGKLLDFLLPVLRSLKPNNSYTRKSVNEFIYRNWRNSNKTNIIEGIKITYKGQSGGIGSQHEWRVDISDATSRLRQVFEEFQRGERLPVPIQQPQHNQGQNALLEWNGLFFRSPAELAIAKALDQRGILFFPNTRGRVPNRNGQQDTIEVDFIVVYQGQMGILEVDGATYHPSAAADHKRDRLFIRQSMICSRFAATDCMTSPDEVVAEFLELFAKGRLS
ncbi:hypothetical protein [Laspinema olomoucense]|uniref:hypothetical protein n=1 Tax=Laspinema olomoucense TaxID=3231600 RepID=UPI0021BA90D2|nr:hypothetical protein [Laspinema sp. D3d]MCT7971212.1 hypothetical protein [Laspinema sp. D3d]